MASGIRNVGHNYDMAVRPVAGARGRGTNNPTESDANRPSPILRDLGSEDGTGSECTRLAPPAFKPAPSLLSLLGRGDAR